MGGFFEGAEADASSPEVNFGNQANRGGAEAAATGSGPPKPRPTPAQRY